jgi:tetratricopeptide (TPR) repeat protein
MTLKHEMKWLILIAVVTIGVFANSLGGEFVYDDRRQIVSNALIQTPSLYGKALSNDVWAFKGDGTIAASNYWRPTFTAWCIINFAIFGLDTSGWHFTNLLLQIVVCLLAFLLLLRWGAPRPLALAITVIFAVHPVHTESVAWISGSPDLLFGLFLLASFWFAENAREGGKTRSKSLVLAVLCYVLALGAKEVALLCFPAYYLVFNRERDKDLPKEKSSGFNQFALFAGLAVIFFLSRWMVLGQIARPAEGAVGIVNSLISAPAVFVFYLRQIVFPFWVGINYPLRPVEQIGLMSFFVPLLVSVAVSAALLFLERRSFLQKVGFALFILPLLSVFNLSAFPPDQIVHDRYLYLPLLGFLMVVVPFVYQALGEKAEKYLPVLAVIVSIPLAVQTFIYNGAWHNELRLWHHAVRIDPLSAINWSQLGSAYEELDRTDDAIGAFTRALEIRPTAISRIGRAQSLVKKGRLDEAIADLQIATSTSSGNIDAYTLYQGYEGLALVYQQKNMLDKPEKVLKDGRTRLPIYRAALTEKLAVILYLQNRKSEALSELESMKAQARIELLPASKAVFLRLGMLYAELERKDEARASLHEYLALTASAQDKQTPGERKQAEELLRKLK